MLPNACLKSVDSGRIVIHGDAFSPAVDMTKAGACEHFIPITRLLKKIDGGARILFNSFTARVKNAKIHAGGFIVEIAACAI